jgi:hypothetical protein
MIEPSVPFAIWGLAAIDPILVLVAVYMGWKADQPGKIFIAAIAALGASLLVDWALTRIGFPLLAPVSATGPMLLPVRSVAALGWAAAGYVGRRLVRR